MRESSRESSRCGCSRRTTGGRNISWMTTWKIHWYFVLFLKYSMDGRVGLWKGSHEGFRPPPPHLLNSFFVIVSGKLRWWWWCWCLSVHVTWVTKWSHVLYASGNKCYSLQVMKTPSHLPSLLDPTTTTATSSGEMEEMECSNGIAGMESADGKICCTSGCKQCGGAGCSTTSLPEYGAEDCCASDVSSTGWLCSVTELAPCIIDDDGGT